MKGTKQQNASHVSVLYEYSSSRKSKLHGIGNFSKLKILLNSIGNSKFLHLKKVKNLDFFYVDKMINMSGFIGTWHEAFVLGKPEAISKICQLKK